MKLSEFILLSEQEKKAVVLHEGILVAKRSNPQSMVFLFQMETYYVETYCNTESRSISEFRVFEDTRHLHPYLESIAIDDLLN